MTRDLPVSTPLGPARWVLDGSDSASVLLLLGHGAGGGVEAPDLALLADRLPRHDVLVARFEQPWRTAGKRVAPAPARLDQAWLAAVPQLLQDVGDQRRLVVGGRSAGARVACRTAGAVDAQAVLALSFPLHPPGRPEKSRLEELLGGGVPTVALQGSRDPFGTPDEVLTALAGRDQPDTPAAAVSVLTAPDCGHELVPAKRAPLGMDEMWQQLLERLVPWLHHDGRRHGGVDVVSQREGSGADAAPQRSDPE